MKVLLGLDPELEEPWVVDAAAQVADDPEDEIVVIAVDDVESQRFEPRPRSELLDEARQAAARAAERLEARGVRTKSEARSGRAADTLLDAAEEIGADLIVVGASPRGPLAERMLGSLPIDLVRRSTRQVLVVTPPSPGG